MKAMVTYVSWTGNTKKVAETIFEELNADKEIMEFSEVHGLEGYDLVFVGFPMHGLGQPPEEAKHFVEKHCSGKKVVFFITHGAIENLEQMPQWLENCKTIASDAELVDVFNCQGEVAQEQIDRMLQYAIQMIIYAKGARNSSGQPDESRLERARDFTRKILKKLEG